MKNFQLISAVIAAATILSACGGGGGDSIMVINKQLTIDEGDQLSYQLSAGTYDATITSSNHGITVSWLGGSSCSNSGETKTYSGMCNIEKSGQLVITNPTTLGLGGSEIVVIRVDKS